MKDGEGIRIIPANSRSVAMTWIARAWAEPGLGHEAEMATRSTFYLDGQWHIGPSYYSAESKWQNESHTASDVRDRIIRVKSYQIKKSCTFCAALAPLHKTALRSLHAVPQPCPPSLSMIPRHSARAASTLKATTHRPSPALYAVCPALLQPGYF